MVSRLYSTVLYNVSMCTLNILSEEVNYEERFRLVLKNYTLLRSFYNLENFALCCSWIVVVCFAKGFSFLTHCIFFKSRDVCFSVLDLVLPLFLMNAVPYYDLRLWYSNLCPSPIKKNFIWLHQIFVAACGIWFPDQGLNPGTLQSPVLFLPLKSRARYSASLCLSLSPHLAGI